MKKIALILAAIISAATFFKVDSAEAGGRRMNFGYPLGSFHASNHSGGHHSSHNSYRARKAAQRRAAARKAAARRAAARKAAARRKIAARKAAAAKAQKLAEIRKAKAEKAQQAAKVEKSNEDHEWHAPVRASAIAGTNTLNFRKKTSAPAEVELDLKDTTPEFKLGDDDKADDLAVAELACKRYIPSAGLTVTVPCGE